MIQAIDDRDLAFADLPRLAALLAGGAVTAEGLASFFLDRLDTVGRRLNAVACLDAPGALAAARAADARRAAGRPLGPLDGIPFAVKDNIETAPPLPTAMGVASLGARQARDDAEAVARLKAQGAVLLGKLALMELMAMLPFERFDASSTGPARNPYDMDAWTGDSSTGPAAAVAAGCVPFALATETRGSIVQPAAFCGVVGLRPTHGLVPRGGVFLISPTVDRVGPMARTPADALAVLAALSGEPLPHVPVGRPRIGLLHPVASADAEVRANLATLAGRLEAHCDVVPTALPDLDFMGCLGALVTQEARAAFAPLIADGTVAGLISPSARDGGALAAPPDAAAEAAARAEAARIEAAFLGWMAPFDALLAATNPRVAPPLDTTFLAWFGDEDGEPVTTLGALLGLPALTFPCGLGAAMRPVGAQLIGRRGSDALLAALAGTAAALLPVMVPPTWSLPDES